MPDRKPALLFFSPLSLGAAQLDPAEFEIVRMWEEGELEAHAADVVAIIGSGYDPIDAALLDRLPALRIVALVGAGYERIDVAAIREAGLVLTNASGVNAADVADVAVVLALAAWRDMLDGDRYVRSGDWARREPRRFPRSLGEARLGIVGFGHIGAAIAARMAPIVPEMRWWGPRPKPDVAYVRMESLQALAEWANLLIVAAPAAPETEGLIGAGIIAALGETGVIVNVGRGSVIDEDALIAALREGRLAGAGLDVFAAEPTPAGRWDGVPNTVFSPHNAGATHAAIAGGAALALENVRQALGARRFVNVIVGGA